MTVSTDPVTSARVWFPKKQFWNDGQGNLFATEWILKRINSTRKQKREPGAIRIDRRQGFFE